MLTTIPQIKNYSYIVTTTNQIISTIKEIPITFPEIKNEETFVVLLGFSQFKVFNTNFTFNIYLTPTKNTLYTKLIQFPMIITYNRNIRRLLKETKANCTLDLVKSDIKYKYYCHVDEETNNIKEVKLIPDFYFVPQVNVTLTGISPLAKMFMNNMITLMHQDNIYGSLLENAFVYILDNSKFIRYDKFLFNITGEINDPQPKLDNKNLILMINLENNEKSEMQIQCNISNITRNNYILNFKVNETFKGDVQSAVSIIDNNDILLVNDDSSDGDISATNSTVFLNKDKSGISAGGIVAIILCTIAAIAAVFGVLYFLKGKTPAPKKPEVIESAEHISRTQAVSETNLN